MLQSLGERLDQVPGVPPAGPGDHAHHQGVFVSKDDGMFSISDSTSKSMSHIIMLVLISDFAIRYGLGYNLGIANRFGKLRDFGSVGKQTEFYLSRLFLTTFSR